MFTRKKGLRSKILLFGVLVFALQMTAKADEVADYIEEVTFEATDKNATREFQEKILIDDKNYKLSDVEYELVKETPVINQNEVIKVITTDVIADGDDYVPEESMIDTDSGITYTLSDIVEVPTVISGAYEQIVTGFNDYSYAVTQGSVPGTKEITATNSATGEQVTVNCNLINIETISGDWKQNNIYITFLSYDADIFVWNGVTVSKDTNAPLQGYESLLLSSVGENSSTSKVTSTYWVGEPYTNSEGILCRDARADVEQYVNYYRANYSGKISTQEKAGVIFTLTYKGIETIESNTDFIYTLKATAKYEEIVTKEPSNLVYLIGGSIAIIMIVAFIVIAIYMISKKKRKTEEEKCGQAFNS